MNKEWKGHGKCSESEIISLVADKPYDCFVAYQTDRFIAGRNTADKLRQIELDVPFIEKVREVFGKKKIKLKADDLEGMVDELCRSSSKR